MSATPASGAQLAKIVLQPADFPTGWEHTRYKADPGGNAATATADAEFAKCLGVPNSDLDQVAEAHSDDFAQGAAQISSTADSYKSQNTVDADTAALHRSKASSCFEQQLKKALASSAPTGGTIDSVSVKIMPGPAGAPANVVETATGTAKVVVSGTSAVVHFSHAFIAGPLIEAGVDAFSPDAPVPTSLMDSLIAAVANRAAQQGQGAPRAGSATPPIASASPRRVTLGKLRPGDCIDGAPAEKVQVKDLPVVPCGQPHDEEVFASRDIGTGPWPGDAAISKRSDNVCTLEFAIYVGIPYEDSRYDISEYSPTKESWEIGDRSLQCLITDSRGKTTGTLRGARS